jgi:protein involved in polysaccharide export with SLBB domain
LWLLGGVLSLGAGGCKEAGDFLKVDRTRFLAPEHVVRQPEGSPINPILADIGPADRSQALLPNAEFPAEADWQYSDEDYVIGPTDIVDISVLDLMAEGLETVLRREVSETGYIDLPLLGERRVKTEGLTAKQLQKEIVNVYSPNILRNPVVSVTIAARRNNTFSMIGAISRPGTYSLTRRDMRLLDALALGGGVSQMKIKYLYVIRQNPATRIVTSEEGGGAGGKTAAPVELPPLPEEIPGGGRDANASATRPGPAPAAATSKSALDANDALRALHEALQGPGGDTRPAPAPGVVRLSVGETGPAAGPAMRPAPAEDKWVYAGGKWVRATSEPASQPAATPTATAPTTRQGPADPFGWKKVDKSDNARIVAVNLDQLQNGDPRMNIIVRNNDVINIPLLDIGEFYISGEVARPGVYSLTGRQITLKQAVAAAGNMGPLAWPENTILIRRVGGAQEQVIPVDLEAIFRGQDPDVYLKPDDVIAVGSDARSSFLLVLRNAFRMTYGFGFIYDRNFAVLDEAAMAGSSKRFSRW